MAGTMKLTDGIDVITFSSRPGYENLDDRKRTIIIDIGGNLSIKEFGDKRLFSIPLNNISSSDALLINGWWQDLTELKLIADTALITATTIAFSDNDPLKDTIIDSGSGFVTAGIESAMHITIETDSTTNDGDYVVDSIIAGTITLTASGSLTTEGAGQSVSIGVHYDNMYLINDTLPLQMMGFTGWDNKYEGTLLIREL